MNRILVAFIILGMFSYSCDHAHNENESEHSHDEHTHSHQHEGEEAEAVRVSLMATSASYELFIESDAFTLNGASNLLLHLTGLKDFKPIADAQLRLELISNGAKPLTVKAEKLHRGIFTAELKPEFKGEAVLRVYIDRNGKSELISFKSKVYSCMHEAEQALSHNHEHGEASGVVTFTKEQSWKIDFALDTPRIKRFGSVVRTTAKVAVAPSDELTLVAKASGVVARLASGLVPGRKVTEGEKLLFVTNGGLASNNVAVRYAEAQNNFEKEAARYRRIQALAADTIVSVKQLEEARTAYMNAKAELENLRLSFSADGQLVVAPFTGYITEVTVRNGQSVNAGDRLLTIQRKGRLNLMAKLAPRYAEFLTDVADANVVLPDGEVRSLREMDGRIVAIGRAAEPNGFLLPITLQVASRADLVPGSFVDLYLISKEVDDALTVPNSALLEQQGNYFVMVQVAPEAYEKREIVKGQTDGKFTRILDGLTGTERIVTRGAMLVDLAKASGALDAHSGHVH